MPEILSHRSPVGAGGGLSRAVHLTSAIAAMILGLASRYPPLQLPFFGKYPGDELWALMVYFGIGAIAPRATMLRRGALTLAICVLVELAKLDQAPWLSAFRSGTAGHLLLGRRFTPMNLPVYLIGVLTGIASEALARRALAARPSCGIP